MDFCIFLNPYKGIGASTAERQCMVLEVHKSYAIPQSGNFLFLEADCLSTQNK